MTEYKLSNELAEIEFNRFCEEMDIDTDCHNEEDQESLDKIKSKIIKALMTGNLVINDDGEPVYTTKKPVKVGGEEDIRTLTFYDYDGELMTATHGYSSKKPFHQMFALMGKMTRTSPAMFMNMNRRDLAVCNGIATLFLA